MIGERAERPVIDVAPLPTEVFGHRSVVWWGTLGFMLVEGTTLAVAAMSYFYLRLNFPAWPPPGARLPDLLLPTINLVVILAAILPMRRANRAAHALDAAGVRRALLLAAALGALAVLLRAFEFDVVNTDWDEDAYGSVVWFILGLHATLLLIDVLETGVFAAIFLRGKQERKHYSDVEDAALYQYFLSLVWVPLYVIVYLVPRIT